MVTPPWWRGGFVCSDCDIVGKVNGVCFTFSKEGRPSGEAFVELKNPEDFKNAIAKDRKYMGHRYIEGRWRQDHTSGSAPHTLLSF